MANLEATVHETLADLPVLIGVVGPTALPANLKAFDDTINTVLDDIRTQLNAPVEPRHLLLQWLRKRIGYEPDFTATPVNLLADLSNPVAARVAGLAAAKNIRVIPVGPVPAGAYAAPLPPADEVPLPALKKATPELATGAYIARRSQLLIAVTTGSPGGLPDQLAELALTGNPDHLTDAAHLADLAPPFQVKVGSMDETDTGPVYKVGAAGGFTIEVPGKPPHKPLKNGPLKGQSRAVNAFTWVTHWCAVAVEWVVARPVLWGLGWCGVVAHGGGSGPAARAAAYKENYLYYRRRVYQWFARFRRDVIRLPGGEDCDWEKSRKRLTGVGPAGDPGLRRLQNAFATADRLAIRYQSRSWWAGRGLGVCVFLAVIFFSAYAHLANEGNEHAGLAGYAGLLVLAEALYLASRLWAYQDRHQDYRTLAEGLAVQFYWYLSGIPDYAADRYLTEQRSELSWIRYALLSGAILGRPADLTGQQQPRVVRDQWVNDQLGYYESKEWVRHKQEVAYGQAASGFLLGSLFLAARELYHWVYHPGEGRVWTLPVVAGAAIGVGVVLSHAWVQLGHFVQRTPRERLAPLFAWHVWWVVFGLGAAIGLTELIVWANGRDYPNQLVRRVDPGKAAVFNTKEHPWLVTCMVLWGLVAILLKGYAERQAFAQEAKQYGRMGGRFGHAKKLLNKTPPVTAFAPDQQEVLRTLGQEALAEHAAWLVLRRERPLQVPKFEL